ncbi:hypothetical protein Aduo_004711 [Ancylostoma duodenale]
MQLPQTIPSINRDYTLLIHVTLLFCMRHEKEVYEKRGTTADKGLMLLSNMAQRKITQRAAQIEKEVRLRQTTDLGGKKKKLASTESCNATQAGEQTDGCGNRHDVFSPMTTHCTFVLVYNRLESEYGLQAQANRSGRERGIDRCRFVEKELVGQPCPVYGVISAVLLRAISGYPYFAC